MFIMLIPIYINVAYLLVFNKNTEVETVLLMFMLLTAFGSILFFFTANVQKEDKNNYYKKALGSYLIFFMVSMAYANVWIDNKYGIISNSLKKKDYLIPGLMITFDFVIFVYSWWIILTQLFDFS